MHQAAHVAAGGKVEEPAPEQKPAVPIKKSVTPDAIICLEDGRSFKSLKRHLMTKYGMTPAEYRAKWGLPSDYPMVAPNYAAARSELAEAWASVASLQRPLRRPLRRLSGGVRQKPPRPLEAHASA